MKIKTGFVLASFLMTQIVIPTLALADIVIPRDVVIKDKDEEEKKPSPPKPAAKWNCDSATKFKWLDPARKQYVQGKKPQLGTSRNVEGDESLALWQAYSKMSANIDRVTGGKKWHSIDGGPYKRCWKTGDEEPAYPKGWPM